MHCIYSLWSNNKVSCNILCGHVSSLIEWTPKNELIFFNEKSGAIYYRKFKYFQLISFSFTNKYKTFWFIFQHPWAISLKITVFCVTCNVSNLFFRLLFDFFFFLWCSLILNSWLVGSLKCHTSLPRNPWGTRGRGWGMETLLSGDQYEDCKGFILCPLVMVSITKERLSQLTLSYCSLFTLNKRNMT